MGRRTNLAGWRSRIDASDVIFLLVALVAFVLITYWGRTLTFWHDDWKFLAQRADWSLDSLMQPFNGHWNLTSVVAWKALLEVVGLSTYLPYLALITVAHIATAGAVYWGAKQLAGSGAGLCAGLLMLVLGSAGSVLFHGQAINLVLSAALGSWALVLVLSARGRHSVLVAALLLIAVASGGNGLPFIAAVAVFLLYTPERRAQLWVIVPASATFAGWWLLYGRHDQSITFKATYGDFLAVWDFLRDGTSYAAGAVGGYESQVGLIVVVTLILATVWQLLGRGPYLYTALAALAGFVTLYLLTALVGIHHAGRSADAPRYVYGAAVFLILAAVAWYGSRPRPIRLNALPILAIVVWALAANFVALRFWAEEWYPARSEETRAAISVVLEYGGSEQLPDDRWPIHPSDPFMRNIPSPALVRAIIDQYGSPLDDRWQPGTYAVTPEVRQRIEAEILGVELPPGT